MHDPNLLRKKSVKQKIKKKMALGRLQHDETGTLPIKASDIFLGFRQTEQNDVYDFDHTGFLQNL